MKKAFRVVDKYTHAIACKAVAEIDYTKPMQVKIEPYVKGRTLPQNRLYWAWVTDFSKTIVNELAGNIKDYWHDFFKEKYLCKIYARDDYEYAAMLHSLIDLKKLNMQAQYQTLKKFIVENTSTTKATVIQWNEYLNKIEDYANSYGVILRKTIPEYYDYLESIE